MSKPQSIYMSENVDKFIQIIESRIDLIPKTTYLYDPQYCSKYNEDYSLKYSHIIGEFVQIKKTFKFAHYKSIHERLSKLECCLHSRLNNKIKTFPPFGNELLPPSKYISLKSFPIMYPLKQNNIFD